MNKILAFLIKDLKNEYRTKELFSSVFTFALLIIVIFNFTFSFSRELVEKAMPSFIWISFLFAGILGLSRSFGTEKDNDAIKGTLLTPVNRSVLFISKFLSNLVFLTVIELILFPLFIVFFNYEIKGSIPGLIVIIISGTAGFVSVGTLFSAMSMNTRLREVILPIMLFPVVLPLLINAVRVTQAVMSGKPLEKVWYSIELIFAFDLIFLIASALVYEYVLEDD